MAIKRLNKNDIIRGRIFDTIASVYGGSVLGFYEGKLRIEIVNEETGEIVQFSVAPTIHKAFVDEEECDPYVDVDTRIAEYQASLKKNEEKEPKKKKSKPATVKKEVVKKETVPTKVIVEEFNFDEPVAEVKTTAPVSLDEQSKLDALMAELGF